MTLKLAKFFKLNENFFENKSLRFIIGKGFDKAYSIKIINSLKKTNINVNFVKNCGDLFKHIGWSDLTICSNGLTKYETAFQGIPSMIFSFDSNSHKIHHHFNKLRSSIYLGKIQNMKNNFILNKFKKLNMIWNLEKNYLENLLNY